jgi:histone H3/H4
MSLTFLSYIQPLLASVQVKGPLAQPSVTLTEQATLQVASVLETLAHKLAYAAHKACHFSERKKILTKDILYAAANVWKPASLTYVIRASKTEETLILPIRYITKILRGATTYRVGAGASKALTAIVEFFIKEWLDQTLLIARYDNGRILTRQLFLAVQADELLEEVFSKFNIMLLRQGVTPYIHQDLIRLRRIKVLTTINRYQKGTELLHQRAPIKKLIKALAHEKVRFGAGVTEIIQIVAEQSLIIVLRKAQTLALQCGEVSVKSENLKMAEKLCRALGSYDEIKEYDKVRTFIKKTSLLHMARRAGIARLTEPCYDVLRDLMCDHLERALEKSWLSAQLRNKTSITIKDLKQGYANLGLTIPL